MLIIVDSYLRVHIEKQFPLVVGKLNNNNEKKKLYKMWLSKTFASLVIANCIEIIPALVKNYEILKKITRRFPISSATFHYII